VSLDRFDTGKFLRENLGLVYWLAEHLVKRFGGTKTDYLGFVADHLDQCLKLYDPKISKISSYSLRYLYRNYWVFVRAKESERGHFIRSRNRSSTSTLRKSGLNSYSAFLRHVLSLRLFPNSHFELPLDAVFEHFSSQQDFWAYLIQSMKPRDQKIFLDYYRDEVPVSELSVKYGMTYSGIGQALRRTRIKARNCLLKLEPSLSRALENRNSKTFRIYRSNKRSPAVQLS
jgi:hypothetical protein